MSKHLDDDMVATQERSPVLPPHSEAKPRDPDRRPLLVDKTMFSRMQATQRMANARKNFPNIDLALFATAALRLVFELPNADQLIIRQVLSDLAAVTEDCPRPS